MKNRADIQRAMNKPELLLLFMLIFSFIYFYHPVLYDNSLTRLDLTYSIVIDHSIKIDYWNRNTADKALQGGHYYCDKAPGLSLAAAPVFGLLAMSLRSLVIDPANPLFAYLLTLIVVSIPSALSFMLLFRIIRSYTGGDASAAAITLATALGSICFTYSTQFYGHEFAASLAISALYIIFMPMREGRGVSVRELLLCGLLCGAAVVSDYPAALPCAVIAALAFLHAKPRWNIFWLAAGAIPPLAVLAAYNAAAFGNPFSLGYFKEALPKFASGNTRGLGGVTLPDFTVMMKLLFSPQTGLLWLSPFLLFAFSGAVRAFRHSGWKKYLAIGAMVIFILVLLMNAGYYEPYGGYVPGPRFLTTGIPFLSIAIAAGWAGMRPVWKSVFAALAALSIAVNFTLNAVEPHVPHDFSSAMFQFIFPLLRDGFVFNNIGSLLNVCGYYSLIPLVAALGAAVVIFAMKFSAAGARKTLVPAAPLCAALLGIFCAAGIFMPGPKNANFYLSRTWLRYGIVNVRSSAYEEAERDFRRAIEYDPEWSQPYISLGACLLLNDRPGEAVPLLLHAREISYNHKDGRGGDIDKLLLDARSDRNIPPVR